VCHWADVNGQRRARWEGLLGGDGAEMQVELGLVVEGQASAVV
jgi:hypothetical protein